MYDATAYRTADGTPITPGLRVLGYDREWGTVDPRQFDDPGMCGPGGEYFNGWFRVTLDSGRTPTYDGSRMVTRDPNGRHPDPKRAR